jgi:hypothetical protein
MKAYEKIETISGLSLSRGSLQSVYQDLSKASGRQEGYMPRDRFVTIFTEALKGADASLAAAKRAEADEANVKKQAEADAAAAKKQADADAKAAKKQADAEEKAAKKEAELRKRAESDPDFAEKLRKTKEAEEAEVERKGSREAAVSEETKLNTQLADPGLKNTIANAEKSIAAAQRVVSKYAKEKDPEVPSFKDEKDSTAFKKLVEDRAKYLQTLASRITSLTNDVATAKKKIAAAKESVRSKVKAVSTLKERLFKGGSIDQSLLEKHDLLILIDVNKGTEELDNDVKSAIANENELQSMITKAKKEAPMRQPTKTGPPTSNSEARSDEAIGRLNDLINPPPFQSREQLTTWFNTEWKPASPAEHKLMEGKRKQAMAFLETKISKERRAAIDAARRAKIDAARRAKGDDAANDQKGGSDPVLEDIYLQLHGASRKSTLKKRREGKQNGRGTRRGKNRANRTHSNSR